LRASPRRLHVRVIRHNPDTLDHPVLLRRSDLPPERRSRWVKQPEAVTVDDSHDSAKKT
jgi:hypothetical protein